MWTNFPGFCTAWDKPALWSCFVTHVDFLTAEDKEWIFSRTPLEVWRFGDSEGADTHVEPSSDFDLTP